MGIYEILNITKPIKEAILRKATTPELREIAIKEGFHTMQDMGKRMILSGDLSLREYERILTQPAITQWKSTHTRVFLLANKLRE